MLKVLRGWTGVVAIAGLAVVSEVFGNSSMVRKVLWGITALVAILTAYVNW